MQSFSWQAPTCRPPKARVVVFSRYPSPFVEFNLASCPSSFSLTANNVRPSSLFLLIARGGDKPSFLAFRPANFTGFLFTPDPCILSLTTRFQIALFVPPPKLVFDRLSWPPNPLKALPAISKSHRLTPPLRDTITPLFQCPHQALATITAKPGGLLNNNLLQAAVADNSAQLILSLAPCRKAIGNIYPIITATPTRGLLLITKDLPHVRVMMIMVINTLSIRNSSSVLTTTQPLVTIIYLLRETFIIIQPSRRMLVPIPGEQSQNSEIIFCYKPSAKENLVKSSSECTLFGERRWP